MLQARRRLAALLLLVHTTCAGRIVLSVDASSQEKTTVATVLDGGRPLGGSASAYYKDFWGRLGDACNRALADAGCEPSDVDAIEFIPPAQDAAEPLLTTKSKREVIVEPSVLAADIGNLAAAAREVAAAGARWVHVDITDGSLEAGRSLSSIGPSSVAAIRAAAPSLLIDVHLYTQDPEEHIAKVAAAGADRITFQIEMMGELIGAGAAESQARAKRVAQQIREAGCRVGVCLAPPTPIDAVHELCRDGDVELVDVLSVNPGIGGQKMQMHTLDKVRELRAAHPSLPYLLVDGGIDDTTAPLAAAAGANALVSGSYLFKGFGPNAMGERMRVLESALLGAESGTS